MLNDIYVHYETKYTPSGVGSIPRPNVPAAMLQAVIFLLGAHVRRVPTKI